MEAKIRIIEVYPKLKCFKINPKDIISISFVSDNYSVKIEDLEKAILSNDKIIINLKESKNKNMYQPIKYSLIRNNNIISNGEFIPTEGIKWYKLNEIKNNISKESLITSSTSNGNIKNNNINRRAHNLSDSHNYCGNEPLNNFYSKNNFNQLNNNSSVLSKIKIKFSINILNKKTNLNKKNNNTNNHYNSIINNNYTKEPSENSSKYGELLLDKDIFNEEEFTITESDISKLNLKKKISTTSKKFNNQKKFSSGTHSKKFSKKKINFNTNQSINQPDHSGGGDILINNRTITSSINNSKAMSPKRKTNNSIITKKYFNEDIKMKTSMGFNKKKIQNENIKILSENKDTSIKNLNHINSNEIARKINSSENIEDEILDQNFKNYLKNDEILKANLSRNNSFNNLDQNNNLKSKTTNLQNNTYSINNDFLPQTARSKRMENNDNKNIKKKFVPQDLNTNSLYADLQLLKNGSDIEYAISEKVSKNIVSNNQNNSFENICLTNSNNENFQRLKDDFLLLYSDESLSKINNDVLFLEIQLMIEKILALQSRHQKEYIELFNSINSNKNIYNNYQNKNISLIKQKNKLYTKKLHDDIIDKKKELYKESINNFVKTRKNIMDKGEFKIWNNMMENSNRTQIVNNNKNKIINIFLNICGKNENHLNKLSLKFYKEIKNKQIKKNVNNAKKKTKINKLNTNTNFFSAKKAVNIKMRIKENETETNLPNLHTNQNTQNNMKINSNKNKFKISKKNKTKMNLNNDEINSSNHKNNNYNFGTMINGNINSHFNNYNAKKRKINKNKSSSIGDKIYNKKRGANKSQ